MKDTVQNLLEEIKHIRENAACSERKKRQYNIFKVLGVSTREVLMCRVLADLLDPAGTHGEGAVFLESFLENVLHRPSAKPAVAGGYHTYAEYPITKERRIDIVISGADIFIPIEVKIHAGDQESQCFDYLKFARRYEPATKIVYLTPDGNSPSEWSMQSADGKQRLSEADVLCISFRDDIVPWLEGAADAVRGEVAGIVRQYALAIRGFTEADEGGHQMEIAKKVLESEANFRSALDIAEAIDQIKAGLVMQFFREFESAMEPLLPRYHLERESRIGWYEYPEQATGELFHTYSTYPGINYRIRDVHLRNGLELWLRIEVEHNLFAGFAVFDPNAESEDGPGNQVDEMDSSLKKELMEWLALPRIENENWWAYYIYLPTGSREARTGGSEIPNFRYMNEAAMRLSDPEKRTVFIHASIGMIERSLLSLLTG